MNLFEYVYGKIALAKILHLSTIIIKFAGWHQVTVCNKWATEMKKFFNKKFLVN